ncbi:MAG: hypothetical protein IJF18_06365 [Oscillospiraceae bacterium]|nr:hypothetical protein [Oscillospiraceae bacterium]
MNIVTFLATSTPKAKRTPLSLDFIIAAVLAIAVFYFACRLIEKFMPNAEQEVKNVVAIVPTIGVFALVLFLANL